MTRRGRSPTDAASHKDNDEPGMLVSSLWHSAPWWWTHQGVCRATSPARCGRETVALTGELLDGQGAGDARPVSPRQPGRARTQGLPRSGVDDVTQRRHDP